MSDMHPTDNSEGGIDRRSLIKRSAIVGGALVWTTPIVQSLSGTAFAQTAPGSPPPVIQGCVGGGSATARYYLKFDVGSNVPDFGGAGAKCQPEFQAGALRVQPPNTVISDFAMTSTVRSGTEGTSTSKQTVVITLPLGFRVETSSVKAGSGVAKSGTDDADADTLTQPLTVDGCIDDLRTTATQAGRDVTITTTNTDIVDPNLSNVQIIFVGCPPA